MNKTRLSIFVFLAAICLFSCSKDTSRELPVQFPVQVENDQLSISFDSQGAITLHDKQHDVTWKSPITGWVGLSADQTEEHISLSSSEFMAEPFADSILFSFTGIYGNDIQDPGFSLSGALSLSGGQADLEIRKLESTYRLKDVEYPAHLLSVLSGTENGYIVVPHLQGVLYPSRYDAGFMRFGQNIWDLIADKEEWWAFESGNLNMPWFGASKNGSSVMATMLSASDATLHIIGNSVVGKSGRTVNARQGQNPGTRMSSLSPIWKSSHNTLAYPRKMRIELVSGGYVDMAKRYKNYAKESGRYVTLRQKIDRNPELEKN